MESEDPKALVLKFYQAFDDRHIEQALALLAPGFVAHQVGVPEALDTEGFKQFGLEFYTAFSQGQHRFDEVIVAGDRVVTAGTFTAKHLGAFQGLPPTGQFIRLSIMHIDRVENGQIAEHWGQGDALGLMQQLGIVFFPGPTLLPHMVRGALARVLRR